MRPHSSLPASGSGLAPASERLALGVWRVPLPSETLPPFDHTNSYLVQDGADAVLVDLGSPDPGVLGALAGVLETLGVTRLRALLLTHTHPDHCLGAAAAAQTFGVPVYAHPLEGAQLPFPNRPLGDGEHVRVGSRVLRAHHTPGHSPGHLSFSLSGARAVLVGDLLTAHSSTWVGHPGGDVGDYLASLDLLAALDATVFGPGHGPLVREPAARLQAVRAHRLEREAEVLAALTEPITLAALRERVYPALPEALWRLSEGSLQAHLDKLQREGRIRVSPEGRYRRLTGNETR
jgi:endoribonuclease LACTB2